MNWIDLKKEKPPPDTEILVCDDNGYVTTENSQSREYWKELNYKDYRTWNFEKCWTNGNGTTLVAWMPLPDWPADLCREDADGEMP